MYPTDILAWLKHWRFAVLALLLLLFTLFWALFFHQRGHVLDFIPSQSAVVFRFPDFKHFDASMRDIPPDLQAISPLQVLQKDINRGLYFFKIDTARQFKNPIREVAVAFSLQPVDSLHPVIILDIEQLEVAEMLIANLQGHPNASSSNFKGHTIYAIRQGGKDVFVAASVGNLLLFSKYSYLVEDALLQAGNRERWWANPFAAPAGEKASLQIGFRPELIAERCRGEMRPLWQDWPNWLSGQIDWLVVSRVANTWITSLQANENWKVPAKSGHTTSAMSAILPDNTAVFFRAGFENRISWSDLSSGTKGTSDFRNYIEPWIGKEAAFVLIDPHSPGMQEDQFIIFSCLNEALAETSLNAFGDQTGLVKKYTYQTYEIRQFLSQSLIAPLLSEKYPTFSNPVCAVINGFVVFAGSQSAIELWIDKYIVSQTLGNTADYLANQNKLPSGRNLEFFINGSFLPQIVKQLFLPAFFENHTRDIQLIQQSGVFSAVLQADRRGEVSGDWANQPWSVSTQDVGILWKSTLNAPAITSPFIVGAENSADMAILIQDEQFQLYRLASNGSILWRKQLDQPIISTIEGIDFYKNGNPCYLFNTADAIWLLDDDGKELVGYPLRLQSPATNGVAVVDFEMDKSYSFFIACQNGNLYGFDQFGRPLPGWNPQAGVGRIKHPLLYFKQGEKDFLAILNLSGQLFVFNRNGTEHFPALQYSGTFANSPPQFDAGKTAPRIVCANDVGRVFVCNLSGQTFSLDLGAASSTSNCHFVFDDLFGDARKDYALWSDNKLTISGYEGNNFRNKYTSTFSLPMTTLFYAGCCNRLGALNPEKSKIYLINASGTLCTGFPLAGTTPFSLVQPILDRPSLELVVGNKEAVYAYKIK